MDKQIIKNWSVCLFKNVDDEENERIMKSVIDFYKNGEEDSVQVPGPCLISGRVYGRKGAPDGTRISTSKIVSIERIERHNDTGTPHDLMCATTKSGSKYYFYTDECSGNMALVLGEMIHTGKLNHKLYAITLQV